MNKLQIFHILLKSKKLNFLVQVVIKFCPILFVSKIGDAKVVDYTSALSLIDMSVEPKLGNEPDCKSCVNCKLKFEIFEFNIRKIFSHSHRAGILHRESQKLNESQKCVSKSDGINKKNIKSCFAMKQ